MNIIMRFLINGLVLLVIDWLLDSITIKSYGTALLAVFILSIMNLLVRPILLLITLPITILTFGLFSFIINAFTFQITSYVVSGFVIHSFWGALIGSLLLSFIQSLLIKKSKKNRQ
ncbi:phage holin family protein [Peribacillus simplex]|uniref:phage holin family protein n=1 Tax=Peribacillus simplex TaxID=1478 RepID=UPI000F63F72E|nr:phage holin family protein [Peribacillus simplex]MDM5292720.1 phage holin family protein [Peribacillus simplex]RRN71204.1 phage holin family protein [Peribacillus simplex]